MPDFGVPSLDDLSSAVLRHRFDDMFNPPGLTNFLGAAQVDLDVVAVRSVNFPPVGQGDTVSGRLYVDGRLFRSLAPEIAVQWRPDRVTRRARIGQLEIETITVCPPGRPAVVVDIRVTNIGAGPCAVRLALALASRATVTNKAWSKARPPSKPNRLEVDKARRAVVGTCRKSFAACVQGVDTECSWAAANMPEVSWRLEPGETKRFGFVHALGQSRYQAETVYDSLIGEVPGAISAAADMWSREIAGAFTPGEGGFSGSLPVLETSSESLRRLYWTGLLGVMYMRRDSPFSRLGRTYDTLMPRYWQTVTFIWDYSLSSVAHALLDPVPMRRQIEHWARTGVHRNYGSEWQTGAPFGVWYSVNDYAMTRLVRDYVRFSGDRAWVDRELPTRSGHLRPMREHVVKWARHWEKLRTEGGLADYGGEENLLECASTYTNEVASLNATNVWCLRAAADFCDIAGDIDGAKKLRAEAAELVENVLKLYVPGAGYWYARHRDGVLVPVRHCYDFQTTGMALAEDMDEGQRHELVQFFCSELQTATWMRAMSTGDADAATSIRPDHQWNGAYTAWPAEAAQALYRLGAADVVDEWLPGLARTTQEGPFAQGHFVDPLVPARHDGAPKGPPQYPYLMDWACSSSGAFVGLVLEGVFGVDVALTGEVRANPRLGRTDPSARLKGLRVGGVSFDVTRHGVAPSASG